MRLIWTTDNADQFRAFLAYLESKKFDFTTEEQVNRAWDSEEYGTRKYLLWLKDEDQVERCINLLIKFLDNPKSPEFVVTPLDAPPPIGTSPLNNYLEEKLHRSLNDSPDGTKKQTSSHARLTAFIILLCSCLFLYDWAGSRNAPKAPPELQNEFINPSPVRRELLFDYPHAFELVDKIITIYGYESLAKPQELPAAGKFLYEEVQKTPVFMGFYPYVVAWTKEEFRGETIPTTPIKELTLFEKIRQGEVWRLWTPVLLHADILHIFFNMIWVLLLGTQIEARLGVFRFLILMLISGCISNVAQYLMSGPFFIGFSGIVCAMATYIKARQQVAPWEAYQMSAGTFAFILFFIGMLALLSGLTFFLDVFQNVSLNIGFANTAHLTGALVGYILGRMKFFAWQLQD